MKVLDDLSSVAMIAAVGGIGYLLWKRQQNSNANPPDGSIPFLPDPVDPTSAHNILYRAESALVRAVYGGRPEDTLGTRAHDLVHGSPTARGGQVTPPLSTRLNPISDRNIAAAGINRVVRVATGDASASLGTRLYDWWNGAPEFKP